MRSILRPLAPLLAALVVAGCSGSPAEHIPVIPDIPVNTARAASSAIPVSVDIPSIGVHAKGMVPLGLNPDKSIQVPDVNTPQVMGWYTRGAHACAPGPNQVPAALLGHINDRAKQGVLVNLKNLKTGDMITVGLSDGTHCQYRVNALAEIKKRAFDTPKVWGPTSTAQIRIISCGGPFVGPPDYYQDNLIGMATLVS